VSEWFHRIEDRLEDDVRHAAGHFHHAGHSITSDMSQHAQSQEPAMPLADTHAALQAAATAIASTIAELVTHANTLDGPIGDVGAVASIADTDAMQTMEQAQRVLPPAVLDGVTTMLKAVIAEQAKTAPAEVPAEPAQEAA
jgi:hypothetical protein